MKRIAFLALAAASLAFAQEAVPAPAPAPQAAAPAPGTTATLEDYKAILSEAMDISEALGNVIAEVKDLATADAAADKVAALSARMKEIQTKAEAMGEPSEELLQVLEAYMENQSDRINAIELKLQSMETILRGETPFFGSEKLEKALIGATDDEDEPTTIEEEDEEESPAPEK